VLTITIYKLESYYHICDVQNLSNKEKENRTRTMIRIVSDA